jgi:hypothetical protein
MKNLIERILICLGMVGGYAMLTAVFFVAAFLVLYLAIPLVVLTIESPSIWLVSLEVVALVGLLFVLSRKKVRRGFKEFWEQILRNM